MKVWVDNDACPHQIKEIILKACTRLKLEVYLVANRPMPPQKASFVHTVTVAKGADLADQHIIDSLDPLDVVITADIPLADAVVDKGGVAINPRGFLYDASNIKEKRSMRDLLTGLRNEGSITTGGPAPFDAKDRARFANALDRTLTRHLQKSSRTPP